MGLSVSVATVIIFSAVVVVAADFVQTYDDVTRVTRDAVDERDMISLERASTAIVIGEVWLDGTVLRINVTNAGSAPIHPWECDLLVDGYIATPRIRWNETIVLGHPGSMLWGPGEVAAFAIGHTAAVERVVLVTGNGAMDVAGVT
ncbi:MAG: hypothetical protein L0Z54_02335 [Thermoplasmata archaeon]|nr:hypothetical protein [Thermoplasmata archaeon]